MTLVRSTPRNKILYGPNLPVRERDLVGIATDIGVIQDAVDSLQTGTEAVPIITTDATQATSSTTGSIIGAGGLGIAKNANIAGFIVSGKPRIGNLTAVAINTTGAGTLAVVTSGVFAGLITSTSAAGVTVTLDSVANMITAAGLLGLTLGAGSNIQFYVDNSLGSSTVTVAVDSGATLAVATPVLTGGAILTCSTSNKIGLYNIFFTSTIAGILSRLI